MTVNLQLLAYKLFTVIAVLLSPNADVYAGTANTDIEIEDTPCICPVKAPQEQIIFKTPENKALNSHKHSSHCQADQSSCKLPLKSNLQTVYCVFRE